MAENYVIWFEKLRMTDVEEVGGKNASLGEMISQLANSGVRVQGGFATTADAYRDFLQHNGLAARIHQALGKLDIDDVTELARVGKEIRQWIIDTPFPAKLDEDIKTAWEKMVGCPKYNDLVPDAFRAFRDDYRLKGPEYFPNAE